MSFRPPFFFFLNWVIEQELRSQVKGLKHLKKLGRNDLPNNTVPFIWFYNNRWTIVTYRVSSQGNRTGPDCVCALLLLWPTLQPYEGTSKSGFAISISTLQWEFLSMSWVKVTRLENGIFWQFWWLFLLWMIFWRQYVMWSDSKWQQVMSRNDVSRA